MTNLTSVIFVNLLPSNLMLLSDQNVSWVLKKNVLINRFILSNFVYCPLVWFISSAKSLNKVEICKNERVVFPIITTLARMKNYLIVRRKHHECFELS